MIYYLFHKINKLIMKVLHIHYELILQAITDIFYLYISPVLPLICNPTL